MTTADDMFELQHCDKEEYVIPHQNLIQKLNKSQPERINIYDSTNGRCLMQIPLDKDKPAIEELREYLKEVDMWMSKFNTGKNIDINKYTYKPPIRESEQNNNANKNSRKIKKIRKNIKKLKQ